MSNISKVEKDIINALEYIIDQGTASATALQRKFCIGYAHASRIIDFLEEKGYISEIDTCEPRKVLISKLDFTETLKSDLLLTYNIENDCSTSCFQNHNRGKTNNIYLAQGYVAKNYYPCCSNGNVECNSFFTEIFDSFKKAKEYLVEVFECAFREIFLSDRMLENETTEEKEPKNILAKWKQEYINKYIHYALSITLIDTSNEEIWKNRQNINSVGNLRESQKGEWRLRYTGEVQTR